MPIGKANQTLQIRYHEMRQVQRGAKFGLPVTLIASVVIAGRTKIDLQFVAAVTSSASLRQMNGYATQMLFETVFMIRRSSAWQVRSASPRDLDSIVIRDFGIQVGVFAQTRQRRNRFTQLLNLEN